MLITGFDCENLVDDLGAQAKNDLACNSCSVKPDSIAALAVVFPERRFPQICKAFVSSGQLRVLVWLG
jgi:hypothetical protein